MGRGYRGGTGEVVGGGGYGGGIRGGKRAAPSQRESVAPSTCTECHVHKMPLAQSPALCTQCPRCTESSPRETLFALSTAAHLRTIAKKKSITLGDG